MREELANHRVASPWISLVSGIQAQAGWLFLAQFAPLILGFVTHRALGRLAEYTSFLLVDKILFTALVAAGGFLQALYFVAGQELGKRRIDRYHEAIGSGFVAALILAALLSMLSLAVPLLLQAFGLDREFTEPAYRIGWLMALGIVPGLLAAVFRIHLVLQGQSRVIGLVFGGTMALGCAAVLFYRIEPPALIMTWTLAVVGLTNWLLLAVAGLLTARLAPLSRSLSSESLRLLWSVGWPIGGIILIENLAFLIATLLVGRQWPDLAPVLSVGLLWTSLSLLLALAYSQVAVQRISVRYAEGRFADCRRIGAIVMVSAVLVTSLFGFILSHFAQPAAELFLGDLTDRRDQLRAVVATMPLAACLGVVQSVVVVSVSLLRGLGQTKAPFVQAIVGYGIFAGLSQVLFSLVAGYGLSGIWYGLLLGFAITALALLKKCNLQLGWLPSPKQPLATVNENT